MFVPFLFCMTISILKCFDDKQNFVFVSTTEAAESKTKVIRPIAYSGTKVVLHSPDLLDRRRWPCSVSLLRDKRTGVINTQTETIPILRVVK